MPMIQGVLKKIFGSRNERLLKQYGRAVREVNAFEPSIARLTDAELRAKTDEFRQRIRDVVEKVAPPPADDEQKTPTETYDAALDRVRRDALEDILPEAFA